MLPSGRSRFPILALLIVLALAVAALVAATASAGQDDALKAEVCHLRGDGSFKAIYVSVNAVESHQAHGDLVVGEDVDVNCELLPEPDCSTASDAVAFWCFDDEVSPTGDGADGHDATLDGPVFEGTDIPPVPGNVAAIRLDGVDDYGRAPDPGDPNNLDGFSGLTLAAWVNPNGPQTSSNCCGGIVTKYQGGARVYGLDVQGDEVRLVFRSNEYSTTGVDLEPGEWAHAAVTWDGADGRIYVDGVLTAFFDEIPIAPMPETEVPINIGSFEAFISGERSAFFDGLIDEVYIFDRALSDTELADLFNGVLR